jgi:hypothetical protein
MISSLSASPTISSRSDQAHRAKSYIHLIGSMFHKTRHHLPIERGHKLCPKSLLRWFLYPGQIYVQQLSPSEVNTRSSNLGTTSKPNTCPRICQIARIQHGTCDILATMIQATVCKWDLIYAVNYSHGTVERYRTTSKSVHLMS